MDINDLLDAAEQGGLPSEYNQRNESLVEDITKLLRLSEMLTSLMEGFIVELHISPMDIFQTKFKDLKTLKFHVVYNASLAPEELNEKFELCEEYIGTLLSDEFEFIDCLGKTEFSQRVNFKTPTITLWSMFDLPTSDQIAPRDKELMKGIMEDGSYTISIPPSFQFQKVKCLLIHCKDVSSIGRLNSNIKRFNEMYSVKFQKYDAKGNKGADYIYLPMLGNFPIPFEVPYKYCDLSSDIVQY